MRHLVVLTLFCLARPAQALDAACQRVADATDRRLASATYHQRQEIGSFVHEVIKVGPVLWMRSGGGAWNDKALQLDALRQAAQASRALLTACRRLGAETVDGVADGLPYREASAQVKGGTRYSGVQAPR